MTQQKKNTTLLHTKLLHLPAQIAKGVVQNSFRLTVLTKLAHTSSACGSGSSFSKAQARESSGSLAVTRLLKLQSGVFADGGGLLLSKKIFRALYNKDFWLIQFREIKIHQIQFPASISSPNSQSFCP